MASDCHRGGRACDSISFCCRPNKQMVTALSKDHRRRSDKQSTSYRLSSKGKQRLKPRINKRWPREDVCGGMGMGEQMQYCITLMRRRHCVPFSGCAYKLCKQTKEVTAGWPFNDQLLPTNKRGLIVEGGRRLFRADFSRRKASDGLFSLFSDTKWYTSFVSQTSIHCQTAWAAVAVNWPYRD